MSTAKTLFTLLTKEFRHNRGYFLVAGILLCYVPVIKSVLYLMQGGIKAKICAKQLEYIIGFHQMIITPELTVVTHDTMITLGMAASILLGAILLGEERKGSLSYLVTTPVSRWGIVVSKFLAGTSVLVTVMAINIIFLGIIAKPIGLDMDWSEILRWGQVTTLYLITLFVLALFASILTASVLSGAVLSYFLIYLPRMLVAMVENIAARYFQASQYFSIKAQYIASYLTVTDYVNGQHWITIHSVDHDYSWRWYGVGSGSGTMPNLLMEIVLLLLGIMILLLFAILIFQRLSLEKQGRFFAGPFIRKVLIGMIGLLAGYLFIFPVCRTLPMFLAGLLMMIAAFYVVFELLPNRYIRRSVLKRFHYGLPAGKE